MNRLLVLLLGLFALTTGLFALPLYPQVPSVEHSLFNGHKFELDFFDTKEALPFFDASILQQGPSQLSATYNADTDFTVNFVPHPPTGSCFLCHSRLSRQSVSLPCNPPRTPQVFEVFRYLFLTTPSSSSRGTSPSS